MEFNCIDHVLQWPNNWLGVEWKFPWVFPRRPSDYSAFFCCQYPAVTIKQILMPTAYARWLDILPEIEKIYFPCQMLIHILRIYNFPCWMSRWVEMYHGGTCPQVCLWRNRKKEKGKMGQVLWARSCGSMMLTFLLIIRTERKEKYINLKRLPTWKETA